VIAVFRAPGDTRPVTSSSWTSSRARIRRIRDFRYVPYIMQDAVAVLA